MKVTDQDFFLPRILALSGSGTLESGTTEPMLIRGVCSKTHEKDDYVVKYRKSPRMSIESSSRELIAALIAKELELNVADPVIIEVTEDFVETLRGKEGFKFAQNSLGLNFGCRYVEGMFPLLKNQKLTDEQFSEAERIFALDIFISNVDRNENKQNLITDGNKIVIFDHELAFGFVMDIIKNPQPWIISENDKVWIKKHYFYKYLKESDPNFDSFVNKFEVIDENFWQLVYSYIPNEWMTRQVDEIKKNLTLLVNNKEVFLQQIYKVLS